MRLHLCFMIGVSGLLGGCQTEPAQPTGTASLPKANAAQREIYERAIALFQVGGEEFAAVLREGKGDPVLSRALTMFLVFHMRDAERRQRQRQQGSLEVRSMKDNERYSQARAGLQVLGSAALPTVQAELIQNRHTDTRVFGVEALAALGPEAVPALRDAMQGSQPRYRRYYVEAVSRMDSSKQGELQLLSWSKDQDFSVRSKALVGLGRYGDRHLVLLRKVLATDEDPFVRRQVVQVLGAHKDLVTARAVLDYYAACVESADDRGCREAERTLVRRLAPEVNAPSSLAKRYRVSHNPIATATVAPRHTTANRTSGTSATSAVASVCTSSAGKNT